jgi:hypothetical protein
MAIGALVCGIVGLVACPLVGLVGLVLGIVGLTRINREPARWQTGLPEIIGTCRGPPTLKSRAPAGRPDVPDERALQPLQMRFRPRASWRAAGRGG